MALPRHHISPRCAWHGTVARLYVATSMTTNKGCRLFWGGGRRGRRGKRFRDHSSGPAEKGIGRGLRAFDAGKATLGRLLTASQIALGMLLSAEPKLCSKRELYPMCPSTPSLFWHSFLPTAAVFSSHSSTSLTEATLHAMRFRAGCGTDHAPGLRSGLSQSWHPDDPDPSASASSLPSAWIEAARNRLRGRIFR